VSNGITNIGPLRMADQIAERRLGGQCNMGGTDGLKPMAEAEKRTCGNCWRAERHGYAYWGGCGAPVPMCHDHTEEYGQTAVTFDKDATDCECWKEM
jgi:hypothetical protein